MFLLFFYFFFGPIIIPLVMDEQIKITFSQSTEPSGNSSGALFPRKGDYRRQKFLRKIAWIVQQGRNFEDCMPKQNYFWRKMQKYVDNKAQKYKWGKIFQVFNYASFFVCLFVRGNNAQTLVDSKNYAFQNFRLAIWFLLRENWIMLKKKKNIAGLL